MISRVNWDDQFFLIRKPENSLNILINSILYQIKQHFLIIKHI